MWICRACGQSEKFRGYQEYSESGTEGIIIDCNEEILDYFDRDLSNSDTGERHIEKCGECKSSEIENLSEEEFTKWHDSHFDANGNFYKEGGETNNNPGNFKGYDKLRLLNDELLKNVITIEEYRREVQKIQQETEAKQ